MTIIYRCCNKMQILTKICRKSESRLLFSYENTVTVRTNLRPIKPMRPNDRFLSIALKCILLEKHAYRAYKLAEIRMHKPFRCLDLLISRCMVHV